MTGLKPNPETCFQNAILKLQTYWSKQGCVILQPYDMEMGRIPKRKLSSHSRPM